MVHLHASEVRRCPHMPGNRSTALDAPDPSCLERSLHSLGVQTPPMNVADAAGARDVPDRFPILEHHGGYNTTPGHGGFGRPTCAGDGNQVLSSSFLGGLPWPQWGGALLHGKHWYLAGGNQRLTGAKRGSKTKPVSLIMLLAQEEEAWVVTFPQRLRLDVSVTTVKEVESFPGRWEMGVWSPHTLPIHPGRVDTCSTLQHSPINHCMLRQTFPERFQAKTSLTESHNSCDLKKDPKMEYYHLTTQQLNKWEKQSCK